ncbi:PREDICTED: ras-related protein Rab-10-like [Charadrius vociferus]|uniref:ras-related protein Rab-10-like n=1 Tax=Charadrius vociferus TaxID=50402 RepID=UPI0005213AD0|nr:PREDICTED: ras-related protein Rab-10-like [Charadrius vociferus]
MGVAVLGVEVLSEVRSGGVGTRGIARLRREGIDFKVKPVTFDDTRVKLQIWDTAGQERFHTLSTSYFRGAQGFVLVYDITNLDSFQSITSWMKDIHEKAGDEVDVILLGNKCDKESERVVPKQRGEKLAWEHGIPFFETSAKDNVNIEDAFSILTKEILEKKHMCYLNTLEQGGCKDEGREKRISHIQDQYVAEPSLEGRKHGKTECTQ